MADDRQRSDWLATLSGGQPEESGPVLEDLREQMLQSDHEFDYADDDKPGAANFLGTLEPWQRLVLSLLIFLDVAVCGAMALVAANIVRLPF